MKSASKLSRLDWIEGLLYVLQLVFGFSGIAIALVYGKLLLAVVFVFFLLAVYFRFSRRVKRKLPT
jgi:ABC-type uncharacterized transport system permease subunit